MVKQILKERRRYARVRRIMSVQFKLVKSQKRMTDKSWGLSTTEDMSIEGLSFYADREYKPGDILSVHVIMSGVTDVYEGYGRIVRMVCQKSSGCYLIGVKFIDKDVVIKSKGSKRQSVSQYLSKKRV